MARAKRNPADAALRVRVVEPIHFPDLSERRALKLASVHRYVARAHFGTWLARTGRPDFARLTGVFTPLVHVDFAVTDIPLEPAARLRVTGESRLARVLDGEGGLRHIAREGSWTIRTHDGREVARARLVNVFTRYDVDPARRRVTELPPELGLGPLPSNTIEVPTLDDLVPPHRPAECRDEEPRVWHYGETDPNRHVNGMAYLRTFEEYLATILHRRGHDLTRVYEVRARLVYRKPCFRGQAYHRLAWCRGESPLLMTAAVAAADAREGERPAVAAELAFGLHDETGVAPAGTAESSGGRVSMTDLRGKRVLITGPASQVGFPIARELARTNEVIGVARFGDPRTRERLESAGVRCIAADLASGGLSGVPANVDYVLHFAVVKSRALDFEYDLAANAEGVGRLMAHCHSAKAILVCSTTGVYADAGRAPRKEGDPLGDNHRTILPTYSISKIAAEAVARFAAREWDLPTTIARLNVPYGDNGGWPAFHLELLLAGQPIAVNADQPNVYNPIHEDDILAHLPRLLDIASVPATTINWAGSEQASIEEWCAHLGRLVGREPSFFPTNRTIGSLTAELTRMHELLGPTRVPWRDGMRRMVASRHPEIELGGG